MTKEEFYNILHKPRSECDGCELHLRHCWDRNAWKSIFYITGLDFSAFGGEEKPLIKEPIQPAKRIYIHQL